MRIKGIGIYSLRNKIKSFSLSSSSVDPKGLLQEYAQKLEFSIEYNFISESGSDHSKTFEYEVKINEIVYGVGSASKKKDAQKNAAANAIEKIQQDEDLLDKIY